MAQEKTYVPPTYVVLATGVLATGIPATGVPATGVVATNESLTQDFDAESFDLVMGNYIEKGEQKTKAARKTTGEENTNKQESYTIPRKKRNSDPYIQEESHQQKKRTISDEQASKLIKDMSQKITNCFSIAEKLMNATPFHGNVKLLKMFEDLDDLMKIKRKLSIFAQEKLP